MIELLALPAWDTGATPLEAWTERLAALGHAPTVSREGSGVAWIEVAPLRLRGYVVIESGSVEAINFELHSPDPTAATALVESAASGLGWEIHTDEDDEDEDDDEP